MNKVMMKSLGCLALAAAACPALADELASGDSVTEVVASANMLGIKRTMGASQQEIAIGVPWLGTDGASVTIDRLIASGVKDGDILKVYDNAEKGYYQWILTDGEWTPTTSGKTGKTAPWPWEYSVSRGAALWLTRSDPTTPFSEVGLYTTDTVSTPVVNRHADESVGTVVKPVYNLMFSPKSRVFVLSSLSSTDGCKNGDSVLLISTGTLYTFKKNTKVDAWGVSVGGKWSPATIEIPAGTSFWYMSAGGDPALVW